MRSDEHPDRAQHAPGSIPGPSADPRTGQVLAERYELTGRITDDPISIDYSATDQETEKSVLVRMVRPELLGREALRHEVSTKLETMLGVGGRYLPGLTDADSEGRYLFTVEVLPIGASLRDVIQTRVARGDRLSHAELLPVIARLAAAIRALSGPLFHGDVRAERVYFDAERLYLTGPFLLGVLPPHVLAQLATSPGRLGTVLPPEARRGALGPAADRYGIGCIALEGLTGVTTPNDATLASLGDVGEQIGRLMLPDPAARPESLGPLVAAIAEAAKMPVPDLDIGAFRKPARTRRAIDTKRHEEPDVPTPVDLAVADFADTPLEAPATESAVLSGMRSMNEPITEEPSQPQLPSLMEPASLTMKTPNPLALRGTANEPVTEEEERPDVTERTPFPSPAPVSVADDDGRTQVSRSILAEIEQVRPAPLKPAIPRLELPLPSVAVTSARPPSPRPPPKPALIFEPTEEYSMPFDADTAKSRAVPDAVAALAARPSEDPKRKRDIPRIELPEEKTRPQGELDLSPTAASQDQVTNPRYGAHDDAATQVRAPILKGELPAVDKPRGAAPKSRPPRVVRPRAPFEPSPDIKPIPRPRQNTASVAPPAPGDVLFDDSLPDGTPLPSAPPVAPQPVAPRPPPTPMAPPRQKQHRNLVLAESTTAPRAVAAPTPPPADAAASSAARWLILLIAALLAAIILGIGYYLKLRRDRGVTTTQATISIEAGES